MRRLIWEIAILAVLIAAVGGLTAYNRSSARSLAEAPSCAELAGPRETAPAEATSAPRVEAEAPAAEAEAPGAPEIDPAEFAGLTAEGLVVIDFKAVWCPACRELEPVVDRLADEYRGRVFIGKLDIDAKGAREIAGRFGIRGIPTLVFLSDGEEVERVVGLAEEPDLKAAIDRLLEKR
ncbi:MAG: thioredoxin family protein [Planctomycetota bacterium]